MSREINQISSSDEVMFDGIEYINDSDSSYSSDQEYKSTCNSNNDISKSENHDDSSNKDLNKCDKNKAVNFVDKNIIASNTPLGNNESTYKEAHKFAQNSEHINKKLQTKGNKVVECENNSENRFNSTTSDMAKVKSTSNKILRSEHYDQKGLSSKNGAKRNKKESTNTILENKEFQNTINAERNHKETLTITQKISISDNRKINMEEVMSEIKESKVSRLCNLAALQLGNVPAGLPLSLLVELDLSENNLHEIDENVFAGRCGQNLRKLFLQSNKLRSIPATLLRLPRLEIANISNNDLYEIPFTTTRKERNRRLLPALRSLNLEFNHISTFPIEIFESCSRLETLLLSENDDMLQNRLPFNRLQECLLAQRYFNEEVKERHSQTQLVLEEVTNNGERDKESKRHVCITVDNHPHLISQMNNEEWVSKLPWLHVELHKIYPDKITENLFIGSLRTAQSAAVYRDLNIDYVLTAGRELKVNVLPHMKHLVMSLNDYPEENPLPLFEQAIDFINSARDAHKGVLVHCFAGLSRSAVIAAAYLMKECHLRCEEALNVIRTVRPSIRPNEGFVKSLFQF